MPERGRDKFLHAALNGDADLLMLNPLHDVRILRPAAFLDFG